jgi:uncharacterized tellurite resistance protein B-like protein
MGHADDEGKSGKANFHWELIKLLVQIAWADDEIAPQERRVVVGLASKLELSPEQIAEVEALLDGGAPLPPPNMQLLRSRSAEVISAAEQIVMVDDEIAEDENRVLAELHSLLSSG